jgi:hypothetical protein
MSLDIFFLLTVALGLVSAATVAVAGVRCSSYKTSDTLAAFLTGAAAAGGARLCWLALEGTIPLPTPDRTYVFFGGLAVIALSADVCIVDITGRNPNVYYEIALAHSYGKRTIIIGQDLGQQVAFDIAHLRHIPYSPDSGDDWKYRLRERLGRTLTTALSSPIEQSMRFLAGEQGIQTDEFPPSLEHTDKVIWHHSIHRRVANESLFYCLITIEPVYQRDLVVSCIEQAISSLGVSSYVLYETLGTTDLLLRVWLPKMAYESAQGNPVAVFQAEFQRQFGAARRPPGDPLPRLDTNSFQVIEIDGVWGHVLVDGTFNGPLDETILETVQNELSDHKVKQVESMQPSETLSRYMHEKLIRQTVFSGAKMTFFIFITRPRDHTRTYDNIFLGIVEQLTESRRITNTSLLSTNHAKYGWILKGELATEGLHNHSGKPV